MATCIDCGTRIGFLNKGDDGRCAQCTALHSAAETQAKMAQGELEWQKEALAEQQINAAISAIMLTTEVASSLKIMKRIEIVTAECAFGMNMFRDLFAGVRDIVGGRSEAVQKTMRDARRTALFELKREAYLVGANAVVGVDLDYTELGGSGSNMVMLVASGTAVVVAD